MKKAVSWLSCILIVMALSACTPVLPGSNSKETPIINWFTVIPQEIYSGQEAILNWEISDSSSAVTIEPGVGRVPATGSISVSPIEKQKYIITAVNQFGTARSEVTLEVTEDLSQAPASLPVINSFKAQPSEVPVGALVELKWDVEDADMVSIQWGDNSRQDFKENKGSIVQQPVTSTSYILIARNGQGIRTIINDVTVKIDSPGAAASGDTVSGCG